MSLKSLFLPVLTLLFTGRLLAVPVIDSFSPTFASASDPTSVIITGSGFLGGALMVKFNGVTDPTAAVTDAGGTVIQAHVPAGATNGSNPIFISVGGSSNLSDDDFTVIGPGPFITGFTPSTGDSNTAVTITGVHFSTPVTVKFNGVTAPGAGVPTAQQINVNAPFGVTTGPITVTTSQGSHTSFSNFCVPPVFSGFSPAAGRTGTNVIITGKNFVGTTAVRFNGLDAPGYTVLSNGAIQVSVPANATSGQLRVVAPAGSVFSGSNFVVQPTISGFSPPAGPVGTPVTITGANLNVGTPTVRFNGVAATTVNNVTFSSVIAVVPAGASTGFITVSNVDGAMISSARFYLPPHITTFTPSNSPPGSLVSIAGTNFTDASAVAFNGTAAAAFYVTNNGSIGAIVPAGVTTGPISVTTPGGTTNSSAKFYGAPVINSFNPTHGLPGTNVVISGINFLDASVVRFNGSNATFSILNNTTINATVPVGAQTGPISVTTPGGSFTNALDFVLDYTANLSVNVIDAPDPVLVGSNLVYTITIANSGPFPAPGVTLTDSLIGPALLFAATTTQGTLSTNTAPITGALGQINVGDNVIVTLMVKPQGEGTITNIATVTSLYSDPATSNNSVTNTTYVQPLPLLSIRRVGADRVRLIWNAALTNYGLEFKSNVISGLWSSVTTTPAIVGSEYQLTETNNQPSRYYRLHRLP